MGNLMRAAVVSGALFAAIAGQAQAATTVGETFAPPNVCNPGFTTLFSVSPGGQYTVASTGVITSWSFHAGATAPTMKLKVGRPAGPNSFTVIGESALKTPTPNILNTYTDVQIRVQPGDVIGHYLQTLGHCFRDASGYGYHSAGGDVPLGTTATFGDFPSINHQFDLSAGVEPDCDNDGLGDETQDTDTSSCSPPPPPAATANCQGTTVPSTTGTEGDDDLVGTINANAIFGLGGNDELDGVDGNDCVDGGEGDDRASGGADDDLVKGGDGKDKVRGLGGKDRLKGQGGVDRVNGGEGSDKLSGGPGPDKLRGGAARDRYRGNAGDDDLNAVDAKRDRVNCGAGDDKAVVDEIDRVSDNCETVREVEND